MRRAWKVNRAVRCVVIAKRARADGTRDASASASANREGWVTGERANRASRTPHHTRRSIWPGEDDAAAADARANDRPAGDCLYVWSSKQEDMRRDLWALLSARHDHDVRRATSCVSFFALTRRQRRVLCTCRGFNWGAHSSKEREGRRCVAAGRSAKPSHPPADNAARRATTRRTDASVRTTERGDAHGLVLSTTPVSSSRTHDPPM